MLLIFGNNIFRLGLHGAPMEKHQASHAINMKRNTRGCW